MTTEAKRKRPSPPLLKAYATAEEKARISRNATLRDISASQLLVSAALNVDLPVGKICVPREYAEQLSAISAMRAQLLSIFLLFKNHKDFDEVIDFRLVGDLLNQIQELRNELAVVYNHIKASSPYTFTPNEGI